MSTFPLHTIDTAPSDAKELLAGITMRFGFLPNVYAHLAEAPAALEGLLQLSTIFMRTSLSERQRHVLMLTSSVENSCTFCVTAHTRGAIAGGLPQQSIAAIRDRSLPENAEDAAMVSFVPRTTKRAEIRNVLGICSVAGASSSQENVRKTATSTE